VAAHPPQPSLEIMRGRLESFEYVLAHKKRSEFDRLLRQAVPDFRGEAA
jgi:hypothetical protein